MFVGTFIVSLNMYGFQLSVIDVSNNPEWIDYIDEETSAFAWPGNHMSIKPTEKKESKNIKMPNLDDIDSKVKMIFNPIWLKLISTYKILLNINPNCINNNAYTSTHFTLIKKEKPQ